MTSQFFRVSRRTLLAVGLVVSGIASGCSRRDSHPPPDALLLTIDTLRGDRWGCLGDPEAHTPVLDRIARGGELAFEGRATAPVTLPSHTSMMTGLPPVSHGVRDNGIFRLGPHQGRTLAEALRDAGYGTGALVSALPLASQCGLDRGFAHYDDFLGADPRERIGHLRERRATETVDRVERWFTGKKAPDPAEPLFLWVHLFDPHASYEAPPPWPALPPQDPYRAEVAYADHETGRLLETIRRYRPGRTLRIVVVSDHGEGLGEHGESAHGVLLHASTIRVPIVARTERYSPRLLPDPVSVERVPATLLGLLGLDPELNPGSAPPLRDPPTPVHSETLYPHFNFGWGGLRSREWNGWRLVSGEVDRLFRIEDDPGETRDLAASHPDRVREMRAALDREWEVRRRRAFPARERALREEDVEALRSLGYAGVGPGSGAALEEAFHRGPDPVSRVGLVDLINEGISRLGRADVDGAIRVLGHVTERDPRNRLALEYLARAHARRGDLRQARDTFRRALGLGPNPVTVYLDLARVEERLGDRDGQWDALTGALAADPRSVAARHGMCEILLREGKPEEALPLIREAVEIRPRSATSHLNLAQIYEQLGNGEEAAVHWRRVLQLDGAGPLGAVARQALARGSASPEGTP